MSKQSRLEQEAIIERTSEMNRNDYDDNDLYSDRHKNAISDGDVNGKGTLHGGHTHSIPNSKLPKTLLNYSDFDFENGGGAYDINGRNDVGGRKKALNINMYNKDNAYGVNSVDTSVNIEDGQYVVR